MSTGTRLLGVKLLTILQALVGVLTLLGGVALLTVGLILPEFLPRFRYLAAGSAIAGFGLVALAVIEFVVAFGLWVGKNWARIASLVLAVLGIIVSVLELFSRPRFGEMIALILDLVIVYYLMQPRVQSYFSKTTQAIQR